MLKTLADYRKVTEVKGKLLIAEYMVEIMKLLKFKEEVSISIYVANNNIKVTYNGNGFGLEDLKKHRSNCVNGGAGRLSILNCKGITYRKETLDIWELPITYSDNYFNYTGDSVIGLERWLTNVLESTGMVFVENSEVISEIVYNVIYHREVKFNLKAYIKFIIVGKICNVVNIYN